MATTAAHCVDTTDAWFESAVFYVGFKEEGGVVSHNGMYKVKFVYKNGGDYPKKVGRDFAVLALVPEPGGKHPEHFLRVKNVKRDVSFARKKAKLRIAEYSSDHAPNQKMQSCYSRGVDFPFIEHDCDSTGGSSGATVLDFNTMEVVGMHVAQYPCNSIWLYAWSRRCTNLFTSIRNAAPVLKRFANGYFPAQLLATNGNDESTYLLLKVSAFEMQQMNFSTNLASSIAASYACSHWLPTFNESTVTGMSTGDLSSQQLPGRPNFIVPGVEVACFKNVHVEFWTPPIRLVRSGASEPLPPTPLFTHEFAVKAGFCTGIWTGLFKNLGNKSKSYQFAMFQNSTGDCVLQTMQVVVSQWNTNDVQIAAHRIARHNGYIYGRYIGQSFSSNNLTLAFIGRVAPSP